MRGSLLGIVLPCVTSRLQTTALRFFFLAVFDGSLLASSATMPLDGSSSAKGSMPQGSGALVIGAAGQAIAMMDLKAILKDTLVEVLSRLCCSRTKTWSTVVPVGYT